MKIYKAVRTYNIPSELMRGWGEDIVPVIHILVKKVREDEKMPEECQESILILIHKKTLKTNFKTIWRNPNWSNNRIG